MNPLSMMPLTKVARRVQPSRFLLLSLKLSLQWKSIRSTTQYCLIAFGVLGPGIRTGVRTNECASGRAGFGWLGWLRRRCEICRDEKSPFSRCIISYQFIYLCLLIIRGHTEMLVTERCSQQMQYHKGFEAPALHASTVGAVVGATN